MSHIKNKQAQYQAMKEFPFERLEKVDSEKAKLLLEFGKILRDKNAKVNLLSRKDMDDVEYRHIAFCAAIGELFEPADGARIADVGTGGGLPGIVMAILWPNARIDMFDGVGKKIAMVNEIISELGLPNATAHHARIEEFKEGGFSEKNRFSDTAIKRSEKNISAPSRALGKIKPSPNKMFDYATGRSVCALPMFFKFVKNKLREGESGFFDASGVLNAKAFHLETPKNIYHTSAKSAPCPNGVFYFKGGDLESELSSKNISPDAELDLEKLFGDERFSGKKILHFKLKSVLRC